MNGAGAITNEIIDAHTTFSVLEGHEMGKSIPSPNFSLQRSEGCLANIEKNPSFLKKVGGHIGTFVQPRKKNNLVKMLLS